MAHRQTMRKPPTYILLLLIVGVAVGHHSVGNRESCSKNEYWSEDGLCCDKCAPGFRLIKKCSTGMRSTCEKCWEGTYQDRTNYFSNCFRCQKCKKHKHAVEISPCTAHSNTVCGCQPGYHKRFLDSITWDCVRLKQRSYKLRTHPSH